MRRVVRRKIKVLDLYSGAGGAGYGYWLAGCDVTGVDSRPQPHYPFKFIQADATDFPLDGFDFIHASPPCQRYARVTKWRGDARNHPDLLGITREKLEESGKPYIIENVLEAPLIAPLVLCGTSFELSVKRHRGFELGGFKVPQPRCGDHSSIIPFMHKNERAFADAMGCTWMSKTEARQAIPPVYTAYVGSQMLEQVYGRGRDVS